MGTFRLSGCHKVSFLRTQNLPFKFVNFSPHCGPFKVIYPGKRWYAKYKGIPSPNTCNSNLLPVGGGDVVEFGSQYRAEMKVTFGVDFLFVGKVSSFRSSSGTAVKIKRDKKEKAKTNKNKNREVKR